MNTSLARDLARPWNVVLLLVALALASPTSTTAQDTAPAGGAPAGSIEPATDAEGAPAGSASSSSASTTSASGTTSTTSTTTAHASAEGAAGTASPTTHHHSPPRGEGVGEAPDPPCTDAPTFDPSTPRFELQFGGGYAALFHTWRQTSDNFMNPGPRPDGLWQGPLYRAEVAFAFGGVSLSAAWTHLFLQHDGTPSTVELGLLSGEIGVQCACRGSFYVWSFGIELGGDVLNGSIRNPAGMTVSSTTIFASIEHRSMFYLWQGLFIGFDVDFATFIGLTTNGPSGGGILGSLFLGYSLG